MNIRGDFLQKVLQILINPPPHHSSRSEVIWGQAHVFMPVSKVDSHQTHSVISSQSFFEHRRHRDRTRASCWETLSTVFHWHLTLKQQFHTFQSRASHQAGLVHTYTLVQTHINHSTNAFIGDSVRFPFSPNSLQKQTHVYKPGQKVSSPCL